MVGEANKKQTDCPLCSLHMSKQHQTIPNQPEEMPVQKPQPEIQQPNDPKTPEIPEESPDELPDEIPPEEGK